jgi:hypothetical protein
MMERIWSGVRIAFFVFCRPRPMPFGMEGARMPKSSSAKARMDFGSDLARLAV